MKQDFVSPFVAFLIVIRKWRPCAFPVLSPASAWLQRFRAENEFRNQKNIQLGFGTPFESTKFRLINQHMYYLLRTVRRWQNDFLWITGINFRYSPSDINLKWWIEWKLSMHYFAIRKNCFENRIGEWILMVNLKSTVIHVQSINNLLNDFKLEKSLENHKLKIEHLLQWIKALQRICIRKFFARKNAAQ